MQDIDIARNAKLKNILDVAKKIDIDENDIEQYGKYKVKILAKNIKDSNKKSKLILISLLNMNNSLE